MITPKWVLTAANCVKKDLLEVVFIGVYNLTPLDDILESMNSTKSLRSCHNNQDCLLDFLQFTLSRLEIGAQIIIASPIINTRYYSTDHRIHNNIALLKLNRPAMLQCENVIYQTNLIQIGNEELTKGQICTAAGWGRYDSQKGDSSIESMLSSENLTPTILYGIKHVIFRVSNDGKRIYTHMDNVNSKQDFSYGDAGGPLICNGKQYGIFSYVYKIYKDNGETKRYAVWTKVDAYIRWVNHVLTHYGDDPLQIISKSAESMKNTNVVSWQDVESEPDDNFDNIVLKSLNDLLEKDILTIDINQITVPDLNFVLDFPNDTTTISTRLSTESSTISATNATQTAPNNATTLTNIVMNVTAARNVSSFQEFRNVFLSSCSSRRIFVALCLSLISALH